MDPLVLTLANMGGVGALAAVLLLLHREAIKIFREEMTAERAANARIWNAILDLHLKHHEEVIQLLGSLRSQLDLDDKHDLH